MNLYGKCKNGKILKKILIKDFWDFIRKHKYFITVNIDYDYEDIQFKIKKYITVKQNPYITNNLQFKNSLYIEYDLYIIGEFINKFVDVDDFVDIKMANNCLIIPIDFIIKKLNTNMKELLKYI